MFSTGVGDGETPTPCNDITCPNGQMVASLNSIDHVSIAATLAKTELIVELIGKTFEYNVGNDIFPPDEYTIECPSGFNAQPIVQGVPLAIPVGDFPSDGIFVCKIYSNYDALVEFEVNVDAGLFYAMQTLIEQTITYDFDCLNYPDYPLQIDHHVESALPDLEEYSLQINNNVINSETFGGGEDAIVSNDITVCDLPTMEIEYVIHTGSNNDLMHRTKFNTQCIE